MLTLEEEEDILADVEDAVAIALDRVSIDDAEIDDIKLNKLAYFLVQEYNINITYGWFKYGPAPYDRGDTVASTTYVAPQPEAEVSASGSSRMPNESGKYRSPEEWSYHFTEDIRDEFVKIATTETKTYLVDFYDEYAPPKYEELYKASGRLQQKLDYIKENPQWVNDADRYYSEIKEGLYSVYDEALLVPQLEEAVGPLHNYIQVLEDVLMAAKQQDDLTEAQQQEVSNVVNFFYGSAWEWIALLISKDTVRGDNSARLKQGINSDLDRLRSEYSREIESLQRKAKVKNLIPEHQEELTALREEERVLPADRENGDTIDIWTKAGAEVIMNDGSE